MELNEIMEKAKAALNNNDFNQAILLFEEAMKKGEKDAPMQLMHIYAKKIHNKEKAMYYLDKAIDMENAFAYTYKGTLYEDGEWGLAKDISKALEYYKKGMELGDDYGSVSFALAHITGSYVKQDIDYGIEILLNTANDLESSYACYELGLLYSNGEYIEEDYEFACEAFVKSIQYASSHHMVDAQVKLANLIRDKKTEKFKPELCVDLYKECVKDNNEEAIWQLAQLYFFGNYVERNETEFISLLKRGTQLGSKRCKELLDIYLKNNTKKEMQKTQTHTPIEQPKEGCYIATAIYGSYDCPQVWTLRRFRDMKLAKSSLGRFFIKFYYMISPTIVKWFGDNQLFNRIGKYWLDAWVSKLNEKEYDDTSYTDK